MMNQDVNVIKNGYLDGWNNAQNVLELGLQINFSKGYFDSKSFLSEVHFLLSFVPHDTEADASWNSMSYFCIYTILM